MRNFLHRLLSYVLAFTFLNSVFGSWPGPLLGGTLGGQIGFYLGYYGVLVGLFVVVFEGFYQVFRRRNKQPPLETLPPKQPNPAYYFTDEGSPEADKARTSWQDALELHQKELEKNRRRFSYRRLEDGSYIAEPADKVLDSE